MTRQGTAGQHVPGASIAATAQHPPPQSICPCGIIILLGGGLWCNTGKPGRWDLMGGKRGGKATLRDPQELKDFQEQPGSRET